MRTLYALATGLTMLAWTLMGIFAAHVFGLVLNSVRPGLPGAGYLALALAAVGLWMTSGWVRTNAPAWVAAHAKRKARGW